MTNLEVTMILMGDAFDSLFDADRPIFGRVAITLEDLEAC